MTVPTAVQAVFANVPAATLVFDSLGHAYGKAKFRSRCKLTGDNIQEGEAIRKVSAWTRSGHHFEGYISNRALAFLATRDGGPGLHYSTHTKCVDGWWEALNNLAPGTKTEIIERRDFTHVVKTFTLDTFTGKWNGANYSTRTTKQLQAGCKRSKNNLMWRIVR